jgi:hypothetical protein
MSIGCNVGLFSHTKKAVITVHCAFVHLILNTLWTGIFSLYIYHKSLIQGKVMIF